MGKGHQRRPAAVPRATVDANYERTFRQQERYAPPKTRYSNDAAFLLEALPHGPVSGIISATPSGRADAEG